MAISRIPLRRLFWTQMIVVALCAGGLGAEPDLVERLIEQLRAGDAPARREAALRLGALGPRAAIAVGPLDSALDDPDWSVRANAMYSLVRLGSRSPRLLPILAEEIEATPEVRNGVYGRRQVTGAFAAPKGWTLSDGGLNDNNPMAALKLIRPDPSAFVPLLAKALKPQVRQAREAALTQAGQVRSPLVTRTREDWVRVVALQALHAMATWSDPSSPELAGALLAALAVDRFDPHTEKDAAFDEFHERKQAVDALAKLDRTAQERAVAQLAGDLRDLGSPRSYEAAALLLRLQGGRSTLMSILLDFLRDGDDLRRRIAMSVLEPIVGPAEAPAVLRAIITPGADRKLAVKLIWWESVRERPHGGLMLCMLDCDTSLIELGVRELKGMGVSVEHRSIHDLIAIVREPDVNLDRRRSAIIALGEFGPAAAEAIPVVANVIRAWEKPRRPCPDVEALSLGVPVIEALRKLDSEGNPETVAGLASLLEAEDATNRRRAADALEALGPRARTAAPALIKALSSHNPWAQQERLATVLRAIGDRELRAALPALLANLDDGDLMVRVNAARAIALLGADAKDAVPKIVRLIWDFGPHYGVAQCLGEIGPAAVIAVPPLIARLDSANALTHQEIEAALERILPRSPDATIAGSIAAMKAGDPVGRSRAAYELGRLIMEPPHPAEAVAALIEAIGDPDPLVRQFAAAVLGRLAPTAPEAGPPLYRAAGDPDETVRRLAAWGLSRTRR
jgi:HEAT repeat protein